MLELTVVTKESYDEDRQRFIEAETVEVELEHSLLSLSKWESVFEKPFLSKEVKSQDETIAYIKMMIVGPELSPEVFYHLIANHVATIEKYIGDKNTGTTFPTLPQSAGRQEIITAELIYFWMSSMNIPMQCENWHLNRLFTLIQVHAVKNSPKKKMSADERRAINQAQRARMNSRG